MKSRFGIRSDGLPAPAACRRADRPHPERRRGGWGRAAGLAGFLGGLLLAPPIEACRYNVRDLGFIDVPAEGYQLTGVLPDRLPAPVTTAWARMLDSVLADSNIRWELVRAADARRHPAARELEPLLRGPLPAAVLRSPNGQTTNLVFTTAINPPQAGLEEAARQLAAWTVSPTRLAIAEAASRCFGVFLLIEGRDAPSNATARQTLQATIDEIRQGMAGLPKRILEPPEIVTLSATDLERETVLLWSMGLPPEPQEQPRAAVFYGRARWMGPVVEVPYLNQPNLARLFWIIGADCECGMDLAWTRGTTLPLTWDDRLHAMAARSLGFDPASPMVRAEALRILNRYSLTASMGAGDRSRETPAAAPPPTSSGDPPSGEPPAATPPPAPAPDPGPPSLGESPPDATEEGNPIRSRLLTVLAILGLLILLGILLILLTALHRWRVAVQPVDDKSQARSPLTDLEG